MSEEQFDRIDRSIKELANEMRTLHEDVLGRLAALPEQSIPTRSEMLEAFAHLEERLGRDVDPLKAVARNHEERITRLERKR